MKTTAPRTIRNLYRRPLCVSDHGLNFVCAAYIPSEEGLYWGFVVDDAGLPVSGHGGPHLTLIERFPCVGTFDTQTSVFRQVDLGLSFEYARTATPCGTFMELAHVATICAYTLERDVVEKASYIEAPGLADYVSEHIVNLLYTARIIGGKKLDDDVRHWYDLLGADALDSRMRRSKDKGAFLVAWDRVWSGDRPGRRNHAGVVDMVTLIMRLANTETAQRVVADFRQEQAAKRKLGRM
jgi:hypothetical protein